MHLRLRKYVKVPIRLTSEREISFEGFNEFKEESVEFAFLRQMIS